MRTAVRTGARGRLAAALLAAVAAAHAASPEPFTFVERTGVATNVLVTSEPQTPSGFSDPLPVSITPANGAQYSVGGAAYTNSPGSIVAGQTLRIRHTSASSANTPVVTTVQVGDYATEFRSVTGAADRTPEPFTFPTRTGVEPATPAESEPVTPLGYNVAVAVSAGPGAEYRVAGGEWTAASGTLSPGQALATRHTSSAQFLGYTKTYVKVGGVTGYFTSRTRERNPPPPDGDGDGVADAQDVCPATPAGEAVDAAGCSASQRDADGDGVADAFDQCPDTPAGATVHFNGCADSQLDGDADGVTDDADRCPATPAGASVDANGCAASQLDGDADGVTDDADQCPGTAAGAPVDAAGCSAAQRDGDGDGVSDAADECPGTPSGQPVGANGCPRSEFPLRFDEVCDPFGFGCLSDLDAVGLQGALDELWAEVVPAPAPARGLSRYVDPRIGSYPPGFTNPGPVAPFGMVALGPDTEGPLAYGGYYQHNVLVTGFSHVHMSAGVYKGGYFPALPFTGALTPAPFDITQGQSQPIPGYASAADDATEVAEAGYYSVLLTRYGVRAELTATERVGLHRYTFTDPARPGRVLLDVSRMLGGHRTASATLSADGTLLTGLINDAGAGGPVHFAARLDAPFSVTTFAGAAVAPGQTVTGNALGLVLDFAPAPATVQMKVAVSYTDAAGAIANLAELPGWDFAGTRRATRAKWDAALARIEVEGGTEAEKISFYTALYRLHHFPNLHSDVDGRYRGADGVVRTDARPHYSQFSSWDSYRGQNQLQAEIFPDIYADMVRSLLAFHEQAGFLPRWQQGSRDAGHMSGDPIMPFIGEAWCRGQIDDTTRAQLWPALEHLANRRDGELALKGYLSVPPADLVNQLDGGSGRAGTTLEFGIADFALALMAQSAGGDAQAIAQRSLNYRNLLDPETRWIRPRLADGRWLTPFHPELGYGFQEGTSWQYSWLAMHDYAGLIDRMGGDAEVDRRLDVFFNFPAVATTPVAWPTVQNQATVFGIAYYGNQFAPGNEHDLETPYVYSYAGAPWKTQAVARAAASIYTPTPNGLPGNDDLGALSGWLLWTMSGLYPMNPGAPVAVIGSPVFEKITLKRPGGDLVIEAPGASPANKYVQAAAIDGTPWERSWLLLPRGAATVRLEMGPVPNTAFGAQLDARPPSLTTHALPVFGCSVAPLADTDADGIADGNDQCPADAGSAGLHGCPVPPPPTGGDDDNGTPDYADVCEALGVGAADPLCAGLRDTEAQLHAQCESAGAPDGFCTLTGGNLHALFDTCYNASGGSAEAHDDDLPLPACRVADAFVMGAAAHCRGVSRTTAGAQPSEVCALIGGEQVGEAEIQAYERSWVHAALRLQNRLGYDQGLVHTSVVATHNSFNAADDNWPPTLSGSDRNQLYDIPDQLRMGVRAIEIDVHWMPGRDGAPAAQMREPMVCHGATDFNAPHIGCTHERPLRDVLEELRAWLDRNPGEAIVLYVEDHLDEIGDGAADADLPFDTTGAVFEEVIGDLVYRPAQHGASCNDAAAVGDPASWLHVTRQEMLLEQKQILTYAETCGRNRPAWAALFHKFTTGDGGAIAQNGSQVGVQYDAPQNCVYSRAVEDTHWTRVWHDATMVKSILQLEDGSPDDYITPAMARELMRCGMNMPSLDVLAPADGRLEEMVWSWAPYEPAADTGANDCAYQNKAGRFMAGDCAALRPLACVQDLGDGAGPATWTFTAPAAWNAAACPSGSFSVPANGYFNERLKEAKTVGGIEEVWVNYSRTGAGPMDWTSDHDDDRIPATGVVLAAPHRDVAAPGLLGLVGEFFSSLGQALLAALDGDFTDAARHVADAFGGARDGVDETGRGLAALLEDFGNTLAGLINAVSSDPASAPTAASAAANALLADAGAFAGTSNVVTTDEASCAPDNSAASSYAPFKGSLHEHSGYSDGRPGSEPRDYFRRGRFHGLDFMGGTEHSDNADLPMTVTDACLDFEAGPQCLVADNDNRADAFRKWDATLEQARAASDAVFTAFRGFEWTSDRFGHINVFFSRHDWNAKTTEGYTASMESFWQWFATRPEAGGGADGLGVFNHPGREDQIENSAPNVDPAYAFNDFSYRPEADLRMVGIETFGKGGDTYDVMNGAPAGGWYAYALDKGWHVGPVGAEDEHNTDMDKPEANWEWGKPTRAKTILIARDRSEGALREALFARRFYAIAQNHNDIRLTFTADGQPMGARLARAEGTAVAFHGAITAGAGVTKLELVTRYGRTIAETGGGPLSHVIVATADERWYYLRASKQVAPNVYRPIAYSAPIWIRAGGAYPVCGEWLAGDLHVHTTYSHDSYGGPNQLAGPAAGLPEPLGSLARTLLPGDDNTDIDEAYVLGHSVTNQFRIAASRGLDYLAISDHNDVRSQSDPGFGAFGVVGLASYENSLNGHAQMHGATRIYDAGDKSADAVAAMAGALRADGGVFQINHPFDGPGEYPDNAGWKYGDAVRPDTIEVWNIGPRFYQKPFPSNTNNDDSTRWWESWLDRGVRVAATGGSDNHWVATTAVQGNGQPTTWVFATERSARGVLAALRAGRTSISHQPPVLAAPRVVIEADADGDGRYESMTGATVPATAALRVRVTNASGGLLRVIAGGPGSRHVISEPIPAATPVFTYGFPVAIGATWVRAEVAEPDGRAARRKVDDACDATGALGDNGFPEDTDTTYCRNQLLVTAMSSALFLSAPPVPDPAPPEPPVAVTTTDDKVEMRSGLIERTWSRSPFRTERLVDGRTGKVWSEDSADFALTLDGVELRSDQLEVIGEPAVERKPNGVTRTTFTLAPVGGVPVGLTITRTVEMYPDVAGMRAETWVHSAVPLAVSGYSLDESRPQGAALQGTIHSFRAGADWREPDWTGPGIAVGDSNGGTWRRSASGPPVSGTAQWLTVGDANDARLFYVLERNDYASSMMTFAAGRARAHVDLSRDVAYIGPFEETAHAQNPGPGPARHRVVLPGAPLRLEPVFTGLGVDGDDEPWQHYKYLTQYRMPPYRREITFNSNGVDSNRISTGAKDDMDFAETQRQAAIATELGIETFILDDGWQARSGDWCPDAVSDDPACQEPRRGTDPKFAPRFPDATFSAVRDVLAPGGMNLGLWMTPQHFHPSAVVFRQNPQWTCQPLGSALFAYNTADPATSSNEAGLAMWNLEAIGPDGKAVDYIEGRIRRAIIEWGVRYFKFDFTVWVDCGGVHTVDMYGTRESFMAMLDRVLADHPDVTLQMDETNDYRLFPFEALARGPTWYQNGSPDTSAALHANHVLMPFLPPYALGRNALRAGDLATRSVDYQMAVALLSHITFFNDLTRIPAAVRPAIRTWMEYFKAHRDDLAQFTYPLLAEDPLDPATWAAFQPWNPGTGRGALLVFRQDAADATRTVALRNVPAGTYRLYQAPEDNPVGDYTAAQLRAGIPVTLPARHSARVLRIERLAN